MDTVNKYTAHDGEKVKVPLNSAHADYTFLLVCYVKANKLTLLPLPWHQVQKSIFIKTTAWGSLTNIDQTMSDINYKNTTKFKQPASKLNCRKFKAIKTSLRLSMTD